MSPDGVSPACSQAYTFELTAGLLINVQLADFVSVDPGVPYIPLSKYSAGSIGSQFVIINGVLHWYNTLFYLGEAIFCELNDQIYISFTSAGGPAGCVVVNLVTYSGKLIPIADASPSPGPTQHAVKPRFA